jgi:hypothetical protein
VSEKRYLGDSVYAEFDGYYVWLTTENGFPGDPRNKIALEPAVLDALNEYVKGLLLRTERNEGL